MDHFFKIASTIKAEGLDGILITCEANRLYSSGFYSSGTDGMVLVTHDRSYYLTDFRYIEAAKNKIKNADVILVDSSASYIQQLNRLIEKNSIKVLGFEDGSITVSQFSKFHSGLKVKLVPASEMLYKIRSSKDEWEVEQIQKAQEIAESALNEVLNDIRPGVTEKEIAARLMYHMLSKGAEDKSFDPIVVSGKKSSMPHGVPDNKIIEHGDFVTLDFGCKYNGYCSDMTRTVAVGEASEEMRKVYNIVLEAQLEGIRIARAGLTGAQIDKAARDIISQKGYGNCFGHSFGHGIGVEIHESPNLSYMNQLPLPVNAVVSAEPGIYIAGKFGVRIEDMLVLKENGSLNLTKSDKELIIL